MVDMCMKHIAKREAVLTVANTIKIRSDKKRRRFSMTEYNDYKQKPLADEAERG